MSLGKLVWGVVGAGLLGAGCGAPAISNNMNEPLAQPDAMAAVTTGRYQPLVVGAQWVYQVTDTNNVAYTKTSSVVSFEDVGGAFAGTMTYKLSETVKANTQFTWYQQTDTDVRRLHDQSLDSTGALADDDWYTPYNLRIDEAPEHLTAGAMWQLTYQDAKSNAKKGTSKTTTTTENWSCDAVAETVTVPAGTFSAVRITRTDTASGGSAKTQWFVPGVGKVREENNTGHLEQLTSYMIPADPAQASP